ncbi:MAG: Uma2 family endonuclease [Candidatus Kapabacteria bacterium]|jgi:Uma2 family endonuclease|nr:Uma2 family endonuclease [Candidatus Kapabacteria bacterium]
MNAVRHYERSSATIYHHEEAYLQREIEALDKTEYVAGVLYPRWEMMAGGRLMHNALCVNISTALRNKLRGKGCSTFSSDTRVFTNRTPAYLYSDVTVLCGKPDLCKHHSLVNPTLLVEVTSPSSVDYDRTTKLVIYDGIPSVQEYLIVSHTTQEIMLFRRDSHGRLAFVEVATDTLTLQSVQCTLDLQEIYEDVSFEANEETDEEPEDDFADNK